MLKSLFWKPFVHIFGGERNMGQEQETIVEAKEETWFP